MKYKAIITVIIIIFIISCNRNNNLNKYPETIKKKEILIHCGVTMVKPVTEIARIIEEQENCIIKITSGGSGNLYKSIKLNKIGDLFLPGSEKYIENGIDEGFIKEKVFVGYNKIAIMVQKGNPKNIKPCLDCLFDKKYRIVIGNYKSGSIGNETKNILEQLELYEEIINRAEYLTIDSRDLILAIIHEHKLYISLLLYSQNPDIAKKFMNYASSKKGKKIFKKYGFFYDKN